MTCQCRYCSQAVAQSDEYAWCEHRKNMVGKYAARKECAGFEYCRIDAFYAFRGLDVTDPRALHQPRNVVDDGEQIKLF